MLTHSILISFGAEANLFSHACALALRILFEGVQLRAVKFCPSR
jgi:hypothetical protein